MNIATATNEYIESCKTERRLASRTIDAYQYDLNKFRDFVGADRNINSIKASDVREYLSEACEGHSSAYIARTVSSLRSMFNHHVDELNCDISPLVRIKAPKIKNREPKYLNKEEAELLLRTVQDNASPFYLKRDLAILTLFLTTGIRLSELVALDTRDVDLHSQLVRVTRKGGNQQTLPINDIAIQRIRQYLDERSHESQALFISKKRNRMSRGAVYEMVKKYLKLSELNKPGLGVHSLRHTVGTELVRQNIHPMIIKRLLGHAKITSTEIYMHMNDQQLISAVNQLCV